MKKIKWIFLTALTALCALSFVACSKNQLNTPESVKFDENNLMSWKVVTDAKSYIVSAENVETHEVTEYKTNKASYSLSKLEVGDYDIRVKAVGDGKVFYDSDWTGVFSFDKKYETGCLYTLIKNDTEYEITKVGSASKSVYLEDEYRGKAVTRIADAAFKSSGRVEEIYIGTNVTYIGDSAFYNCPKLTKVEVPDTVTYLGKSAFQSCRALTNVNIPKGVSALLDYTFAYCRALTDITIPETIYSIGESAFSDCSVLSEIVIPDSVTSIGGYAFTNNAGATSVSIGKNVETIGEYAFYRCGELTDFTFRSEGKLQTLGDCALGNCAKLETVSLPDGVKDCGEECFAGDKALATVTIPDSVDRIGKNAFRDTALQNTALENGEDYVIADKWLVAVSDGARANLEKIDSDTLGTNVVVGIADYVFEKAEKLERIEVPPTLRVIGQHAFDSCKGLWKISPSVNCGLELIGDYAFYKCEALDNITLGEGLQKIGAYAFCGCKLLDNNKLNKYSLIPNSVTSIGTYAFKDTKLWTEASKGDGVVYAGNWVVGYTTFKSTNIVLEFDTKKTAGIADYAFYKAPIKTVTGLDDARYIGRAAFCECNNLATVSLNRNLRTIEDYTFYNCNKLYQIELPSNLTKIGRSAFYQNGTLTEIDFTDAPKLESIGMYAFYNCTGLKTLTFDTFGTDEDGESLEESVLKEIGDNAFYGCASIEELTLPNQLETLGYRAFYKCGSIEKLGLGQSVETVGEQAFAYCSKLTQLSLPDSVKTVGTMAFYKCAAIKKLSVNATIENIGNYAFYGLEKLTYLDIPENVSSIGEYAFKGMTEMTSIVIKSGIGQIGAHAFYGCKNMTFYTDAEGLMPEWHKRFNSSFRPVVWGCTLSEDKTYVVSLEIKENTFSNKTATGGITAPTREGYEFFGWTTVENGEVPDVAASTIADVPVGTTIYAIWIKL